MTQLNTAHFKIFTGLLFSWTLSECEFDGMGQNCSLYVYCCVFAQYPNVIECSCEKLVIHSMSTVDVEGTLYFLRGIHACHPLQLGH